MPAHEASHPHGADAPRHGTGPGWPWWQGALRCLAAMALGHVASVVLVAGAAMRGAAFDRGTLMGVGSGLLAVAALAHLMRHTPAAARGPAGQAGLALASFIAATAHGAGLMLVPALMPLCGAGLSASFSLLAAIGAVLLHMAAMLAIGTVVAGGLYRWRLSVAQRRLGCWP